MIVTVTMNAAVDRTLTVPSFRPGHRHRASDSLTLAGGKGINIARGLKRLEVPVVATGLAGGRTGTRIVEELTNEEILNDFVRIADESRTSTRSSTRRRPRTARSTSGGRTSSPRSSEFLLEKLRYLSRGAAFVVFAGSAAARRRRGFLRRGDPGAEPAHVPTVLDTEGETPRARDRRRAVSRLAEPARGRGPDRPGAVRGAGFRAGARADRGPRRAKRADHPRERLLRVAPRGPLGTPLESRSAAARARRARGRRRRSLSGFLAARSEGRQAEEALRDAVAAGSASTLEVGAGGSTHARPHGLPTRCRSSPSSRRSQSGSRRSPLVPSRRTLRVPAKTELPAQAIPMKAPGLRAFKEPLA